jgi:hypothetical protein
MRRHRAEADACLERIIVIEDASFDAGAMSGGEMETT